MSGAIYDDLEIEHGDMLNDPNAFMKRVYGKAEELREILRADTSLSAMQEKYKSIAQFAPSEVGDAIEGIYKMADDLPLEYLMDTIAQIRKLASDLETMFVDRCIYKAADSNDTIADKKTAHEQYNRLREATNSYIAALKVLKANDGFDFKPLQNMPGNYGTSSTKATRHVFEYKGEQYRNPRYIQKALGIPVGTLMDLLEYLEENPNTGVTVKRVTS